MYVEAVPGSVTYGGVESGVPLLLPTDSAILEKFVFSYTLLIGNLGRSHSENNQTGSGLASVWHCSRTHMRVEKNLKTVGRKNVLSFRHLSPQ